MSTALTVEDPEALALALKYRWSLHARREQRDPATDYLVWLYLAGRGAGKTRTGAELVREWASRNAKRISLIAPTAGDARDIMVEGESGIMAVSPPWFRPKYEPSKLRLTWPNGVIANIYTAEEPERLRGKQHEKVWCDELCAWRYLKLAWEQMEFGLRLGKPKVFVSSTPKPIKLLKELIAKPTTFVTRGSTYDNIRNLAPVYIDTVIKPYEGTRLGRQEIHAEIIEDAPGALWKRVELDTHRIQNPDDTPDMVRIVVGADPAATSNADSDETGIVVAGKGVDGRYYVLADYSRKASPSAWAAAIVMAFQEHRASRIVYESNQGGDMVAHTISTIEKGLPLTAVHASQGKVVRAEPVASLYEQGRVSHVGSLPMLEDQMCQWDPTDVETNRNERGTIKSPDRVDALVYALTELHKKPEQRTVKHYK